MDPVGAVEEGFLVESFATRATSEESFVRLASKLSVVEVSDSLLDWVLEVTGCV